MVLRWVGASLLAVAAAAQPSVSVSGGITIGGVARPLLFTWNSTAAIAGAGWRSGEPVQILLHGPLDSPEVTARIARIRPEALVAPGHRSPAGPMPSLARDLPIAVLNADAQGKISGAITIPYDNGIVGPKARIPRPGYYELHAAGAISGFAISPSRISLCPDTYTGPGASASFDWGHERGARDGVFPGPLRQFSPERFDPEWPAVWDESPVEVYGTVVSTSEMASDTPSRISPSDNPPTHYAHDAIVFVSPDPAYQWLVGTANYYAGDPDSADLGNLELEWETRNGGSTSAYGQGSIGLPVWAEPEPGDRVYAVGRWILDAGHPEVGDRTEMHPPRLLATLRMRPSVWNGIAATQVEIFVSGHGGGANMMPPGLSTVLNQGGYGGGRIRDALSSSDQDRYYRPGPLSTLILPVAAALVQQLTGIALTAPVYSDAGPSAFPWGTPGPEQRTVNDLDYDFDVPLPAPPAGGGSPMIGVITHPEHSTAVNELVTFGTSPSGATVAHVHLPYRGADNGVYARTLQFAWAAAAPPASHWKVRLTRIDVNDSGGKWQMWADVAGQWTYLSGAAPQLLNTSNGKAVTLPGQPVDVYLNPQQSIRIEVNGYRAACLDDFFGKLFGESAYLAGLTFVGQCGPTDNQDLGTAVLEIPAASISAGSSTFAAVDSSGAHHFAVTVSIDAP